MVIKVSFRLRNRSAAIAVGSDDLDRVIAPAQTFAASENAQEAFFLVPAPQPVRVTVFSGDADESADIEILDVAYAEDDQTLGAAAHRLFAHWYYTVDLAGSTISATVENLDFWNAYSVKAAKIFSYLIEEYIGSLDGLTALDVACSAGRYSLLLAHLGANVYGFDHDAGAIAQAKFVAHFSRAALRGSVDFGVSTLQEFTPRRAFDVVFCSGLFYHLSDPLGGARKLHELSERWLILQTCVSEKPGALFELCDPNRWSFCAPWELCLVPTAAMARSVFEKSGFCVRAEYRLHDFELNEKTGTLSPLRGEDKPESPLYLILEKTR